MGGGGGRTYGFESSEDRAFPLVAEEVTKVLPGLGAVGGELGGEEPGEVELVDVSDGDDAEEPIERSGWVGG